MMHIKLNSKALVFGVLFLISTLVLANPGKITSASGVVRDAETGEGLPFVTIMFENSKTGVVSDIDGLFNITCREPLDVLLFSYVGYNTETVRLKAGVKNDGLEVVLLPATFELEEVVVRPKRQRYSRKNNPAVDLIREVIARKDDNRVEAAEGYQVERYEKLTLALDDFDKQWGSALTQQLPFLEGHVDSSGIDGSPVLTLSVRERLADEYYRKQPHARRTVYKGMRHEGVDKRFDHYGTLTSNLNEMLKEVDIFDNNIDFLLNRFVSPLSSTLATAYYQYYIMDTVRVQGQEYIDLAFVPANSQSFGFTGRLHVLNDGSYAIKKAVMNVPVLTNINFMKHLHIEQEFKQTEGGLWAKDKDNTYARAQVYVGTPVVYAHQVRSYEGYKLGDVSGVNWTEEVQRRDELVMSDSWWREQRHVALREKEDGLDELMVQLDGHKGYRVLMKTAEILMGGYIETSGDHATNKVDIGPLNTIASYNEVEGLRLRAGALTTANLHPRLFAGGYVAYGLRDERWKYMGRLTYSFNEKEYHEKESPMHNLSISREVDIYTPGQNFLHTNKDNMFVSLKVGQKIEQMNYLTTNKVDYEREWLNGLSINLWLQQQNNEAAGTLMYVEQRGGVTRELTDFGTTEWGTSIRFAPGEGIYNSRMGKSSGVNLQKDAPVLMLSHRMGLDRFLGGQYDYHHTEVSFEKRIWLSSFGRMDTQLKAGKMWSKVPFPLLIMPNANQSITIQQDAFHLLNAMELVADQYVSASVNYHLNGLIMNRLPLIRRLGIREVASFSAFYGELTDKNNPAVTDGLFLLPDNTFAMGNKPYMEYSVGVENILKFFRINYYQRLSYLNHPNVSKHGVRIGAQFTF